MPRSPWLASAGCTKNDGVPVGASVAAILRPTWPDLPIPETITRPREPLIRSTAWVKAAPSAPRIAAEIAVTPPASASSVRRAESTAARSCWSNVSKVCALGSAIAGSAPRFRFGKSRIARKISVLSLKARGPQPVVNHNHFIPVNQVLPVGRPLRTKPVPRPCALRLLVCCSAGAVIATALNVFAVCAQAPASQVATSDPSGLLRPVVDSERSNLQKFGQAERLTRPNGFTRTGNPTGRDPNAPPSARDGDAAQAGQVQNFGNPPAVRAGAARFHSSNTRRRRARTPAPPRPATKTAPAPAQLPTSLSPPLSGAARPSGGAGSASPQTSTTTPKPSRPSTTGSNAGSPAPLSAPALTTAQAGQAAARRPQRRGALTLPPPDVAPIAPAPPPATPLRRPPRTDDDPFAPLGVRAGSFLLRPALEVTGGFDTNPPRVPDSHGSPLLTVAPELIVRSDWSRHALGADLRGNYLRYF